MRRRGARRGADAPISYCQSCIDEYGFSCSGYGLSIDGDCGKCAEAEAAAGDVHEYIACETHSACGEGMYCYTSQVGTVPYTLQDCYPCTDESGYTCADWGDSVDGSCSQCSDAPQAISGCTTHGACVEGFYCASYESQGGSAVVDCMPCVDFLGYGCADYGDSIDGSCQPCDGVTEAPDDYYGYGYGGTGEMGDCVNPGDDNSPVALQECTAHADCASANYCSSYMGFGGCIVQCWPCLDSSGISCEEYGDSISGSCEHCAAGGGDSGSGGGGGGGDDDDDKDEPSPSNSGSSSSSGAGGDSGDERSEGRSTGSRDECHGHDNCERGKYCAEKDGGNKCLPCQSTVGGCEVRAPRTAPPRPARPPAAHPGACARALSPAASVLPQADLDSVDGNCTRCEGYKMDGAAGAATTGADELDPWHVFGVVVASVGGACALLALAYYVAKVRRCECALRPAPCRPAPR